MFTIRIDLQLYLLINYCPRKYYQPENPHVGSLIQMDQYLKGMGKKCDFILTRKVLLKN